MEMRMKDDLRAVSRGPANRFWIAPAFVADRDTEGQIAGVKDATTRAWCIRSVFARVDLYLVLKARDRSVLIDHERRRDECAVDETFRPQYDADVRRRGGVGDGRPRALEELGIGRRHDMAQPPIAGDEALGKADDPRSLAPGLTDGSAGKGNRLLRTGGKSQIGERDAKRVHESSFLSVRWFQQYISGAPASPRILEIS